MASPASTAALFLKRHRTWVLAGAAAAVILAGFVLPYLFSSGSGSRESAATSALAGGSRLNAAPEPGVEMSLLTRLTVSTVVVLLLVPGALFVLRRWLLRQQPIVPSDDLRVLGVTRLDGRSQVYLVEARGQRLLVGADWGGVRLLVPVPPAVPDEEG